MKKKVKVVLSGVGVVAGLIIVMASVASIREHSPQATPSEEAPKSDQAVRIVDAMRNCLDVGDSAARSAGEKDQLYRQCWNRAELIGKKR